MDDSLLTAFKKLNRSKILDRSQVVLVGRDTFGTAEKQSNFNVARRLSAVHERPIFQRRPRDAFLNLDSYLGKQQRQGCGVDTDRIP